MTTPEERRRNLIWGREMLEELSSDASVSNSWRREAARLLAIYPSLASLQQFDAGDLAELEPYAVVLSALPRVQPVPSSAGTASRWF